MSWQAAAATAAQYLMNGVTDAIGYGRSRSAQRRQYDYAFQLNKQIFAYNELLQKRNMNYQTAMSNTAHQREVEDLRAAGLNPILSAGGQGASTPSAAQSTSAAQIPTDGADLYSAYIGSIQRFKELNQQDKRLNQEETRLDNETKLTNKQIDQIIESIDSSKVASSNQTAITQAQVEKIKNDMKNDDLRVAIDTKNAEANYLNAQTGLSQYEWNQKRDRMSLYLEGQRDLNNYEFQERNWQLKKLGYPGEISRSLGGFLGGAVRHR